jgi:hypothetical protein
MGILMIGHLDLAHYLGYRVLPGWHPEAQRLGQLFAVQA